MGTLEKLQFAEPWDFLVMLLFGAASLLAGVGIGGGNARFLGHNLSCFLVYIWARTYEGQEVAVMEFFTIRAEPCGTQATFVNLQAIDRAQSWELDAVEETLVPVAPSVAERLTPCARDDASPDCAVLWAAAASCRGGAQF